LFIIVIGYNALLIKQIDFLLKWGIIKKIRVDVLEEKIDRLEKLCK